METRVLAVAGNNCYADFSTSPPTLSRLDAEMLSQFCDAWEGTVKILATAPETARERSAQVSHWEFTQIAPARLSAGWRRLAGLPAALMAVRRELRRSDAVLVRLPSPMGFWTLVLAKILRLPIYCSIHGAGRDVSRGDLVGLLLRRAYEFLLSSARLVFSTNSELTATYGVPADRVRLYKSTLIKGVSERERWPVFGPAIRLCWVGRLMPEKNPATLFDISEAFFEQGWSPTVTVVGDGPLRAEMEERALEASADFLFLGWVSDRSQIEEILRENHFVLLTSEREGSPKILVEGMAVGTPGVVIAKNSTIAQYVSAGAVLQVPEASAESWVHVISSVWNDADYRRLARNGVACASQLTLPRLVEEISRHFKESF